MVEQSVQWRTATLSSPELIHEALNRFSRDGWSIHSVVAGVKRWGDDSMRTVPCWVILGWKIAPLPTPQSDMNLETSI